MYEPNGGMWSKSVINARGATDGRRPVRDLESQLSSTVLPGTIHIQTIAAAFYLLWGVQLLHCQLLLNIFFDMPAENKDLIARGRRESTPLGTTLFCGLRAIDPLLQRSLLLSAPLASLAPSLGRSTAVPPSTGGSPISTAGLGLTPFQTVVWAMVGLWISLSVAVVISTAPIWISDI